MLVKDIKKQALKDYKELKKYLSKAPTSYAELRDYIELAPKFHHFTHTSSERGLFEFHYGDMTLKILLKCAIIELEKEIELWNHGEVGYIGKFTEKTLSIENNGDLD